MKVKELFESDGARQVEDLSSLDGYPFPKKCTVNFTLNRVGFTSGLGFPEYLIGYIACSGNPLTSLEGFPKHVTEFVSIMDNKLTSLEGSPEFVGNDFKCSGNRLKSLKGAPTHVGHNFDCSNTQVLESFEYLPKHIGGYLGAWGRNNITTIKGIHKYVDYIGGEFCFEMFNKSGWSGFIDLLKIKNAPTKIRMNDILSSHQKIAEIINKHLENPDIKERVAEATIEFVDNDLEEFI